MDRSAKIIRVSVIGIGANLALAAFKAAVGALAGSVAVVLDAVNNLSDAFSSVVTIIGTKLAGRPPDRKHPYGHGRVEYISSVTIAVLVLLAGFAAFREALGAVIHGTTADYSVLTLVVVGAAVLVKFFLSRFVKKSGEALHSEALAASGTDAFFDALVSAATLVGAAVGMLTGLSVDGWLGLFISVMIVKAGFEILMESLSNIIGTRVDGELTKAIRDRINETEGVLGTYDLILHRYGPEKLIGSAHVEVSDRLTAREIHKLTRSISAAVYREFGIVLTVGIYAANDEDEECAALRKSVDEIVAHHPEVLGIHGFYADPGTGRVSFDLLMDFSSASKDVYQHICDEVRQAHPDYTFDIVLDNDFSD
ncbi:MAG: cation transporter [Clostridia bacterium]|nr:cation transporter [Clostridia bacterium]